MSRRILMAPVMMTLACLSLVASTVTAQSQERPASVKARSRTQANEQNPPPPAPPAQPANPRAPAAPPAPPPPPRRGQPINIKVDVTITDQRGSGAPTKKTLSVIVADQQNGMVRSESLIPNIGTVPLHIDAEPEILSDGKIRLRFGLNYDIPMDNQQTATSADRIAKTVIRESLSLVLESGKPMLVTQSADPVGDRQVMVEVKATVLK